MMSPKRALRIIKQQYHTDKPTGFAYEYHGDYYIEMIPNGGRIYDSFVLRVNGITADVAIYNPLVDKPIPPSEMNIVDLGVDI